MKRGTNVTYENDESGRGYYAVTKSRGKLTIDGREPQGDYVRCYPIGEIMGLWNEV